MRYRLLLLFCLLPSTLWADTTPFNTNVRCTVLYQLDPFLHQQFNQQLSQLRSTLVRQQIGFVDLTSWQQQAPHLQISGRQRHQLRQQYHIPRLGNNITVINRIGDLVTQSDVYWDVVDVIMKCG
ncbi:hypothetical protein QX776_00210 [Alteromonadaceae bacterium BrNp21-10]|nr:hypothetical protein [Alteromonadaceae bacterium BrNp21-10]